MTDQTQGPTPTDADTPTEGAALRETPGDTTTRGGRLSRRRAGEGSRLDTSSAWFWPLASLIGLLAVIGVNALAATRGINGLDTGQVVNEDPVYFQPAGFTFSIWSVIYLLLALFVVWSFLAAGRDDRRLPQVSVLFLVTNVANISWLLLWHYGQWGASTLVMTVLLVALALIHTGLRRTSPKPVPGAAERLMLWTPFSVYLGWIVVALAANVSVWRDREGITVPDIDGPWWAVLMIVAVLIVAAAMALLRNDPAFTLVSVWALFGLTVEQWDRSLLVALVALVGTVLAAALTVVASLLSYERHTVATALPQSIPPKHRTSVLTRGRRDDADNRG